jgi:putative aldouronate transport system permease protein
MLTYLLAVTFALIIFIPVCFVLVSSFTYEQEILRKGFFLIPEKLTLSSYHYLYKNKLFTQSFFISVIVTVGGTLISMFLTTIMAYSLSKKWLWGRRGISFLIVFTMMFNGGLIPTYLVVKSLGMINTLWSLMLPLAVAPFYVIVMRTFFQNIPEEVEESASIDGCSDLGLLFRIVLPLSIPAIATFTLFYAVNNWNSFFHAIMFITDENKWPMSVYLRQMLVVDSNDMVNSSNIDVVYGDSVKNAAIVIFTVPMLLLYPYIQKYFREGMMLGAVKG